MDSDNTALTFALVDEPMEPHATQDAESPRGPLRFSYATGSRPLDGFTIKRGIGRGGFGEVYFAVSDGGKEVAIKVIRHNLDVELRGVMQCLNLKHSNLIALYDVKQDDQENTWVIMEYATGESLEEVVRRSPNGLPIDEALDWMQGIAAGVGYLHDHGIVHRDLKPGNIFRDDGVVKLGDYGLSKFISCSRRSGQTESIGTVHYMAPEVANGRYGKEIDIYALGIILFEILTGRVPFEGESIGEVLMKHLTAEPSLNGVPEPYRSVIARALAKDPTTRFASVSEFMAALPTATGTAPAYKPPLKETRHAAEAAESGPQPVSPHSPAGGGAASLLGAAAFGATAAAETVQADLVDEEPIWRAIRDGWRTTRDSWDSLNTPSKIALAVLGIVMMSSPITWTFALTYLPGLVILYLGYRIVRSVVMNRDRPHDMAHGMGAVERNAAYAPSAAANRPRPAPPATEYHPSSGEAPLGDWRSASARHWKKRRGKAQARQPWRERATTALVVKSPRERVTDLLGSLIMAAGVGFAMSVVVTVLRGEAQLEQFTWLTATSVFGSWAVLIPSKIWEGRKGEAILRRVALLMIGLVVGGAAYLAADALIVKFPDSPMHNLFKARNIGPEFFDVKDGAPQLYAYLAYFGSLFFAVGWWKQTDPLRRTRLSIWSTIVAVFVAWAITCVWPFPQPWGLMVAAVMAISVQLVSPFVPPHDRVARPAGQEA
jgi:hypothetical protein